MKGVDKGKGNVVCRDDWQTPQWLFNILDEQYVFTFDCCASKENAKCGLWSNNFVFVDKASILYGVVWMNPPFSCAPYMIRHFLGVVKKGVGIYRADNMETKIWQHILKSVDWVHIFDKRINYEGKVGGGAVFGSALFGVGVLPPKGLGGVTLKKWSDA